jgi:ABC-type multidrug transport system ATPase subunit
VEDVSTLCARFAIICQGEVLYSGRPEQAMAEMQGRTYSKMIPKSDIEQYQSRYPILSTQLKGGELYIRILSDSDPSNGFALSPPNLEDVYFSHIITRMDINTL